jgi:hypothetical protein
MMTVSPASLSFKSEVYAPKVNLFLTCRYNCGRNILSSPSVLLSLKEHEPEGIPS